MSLAGLAHARVGESERVVLTFADSAALPARRLGPCRAEFPRGLGLVRVWLPAGMRETSLADHFVGTTLTDRVYVVRESADSLFVDVHLGVAARARVTERRNPAALVIELEPGGAPLPEGPAISSRCVLLAPRAGGAAGYPLEVAGYARTFEANVAVRLMRGESVLADTFATAADWSATWGAFRVTLPDGPRDSLSLFTGETDAESGEPQGVTVGVDLREVGPPR